VALSGTRRRRRRRRRRREEQEEAQRRNRMEACVDWAVDWAGWGDHGH